MVVILDDDYDYDYAFEELSIDESDYRSISLKMWHRQWKKLNSNKSWPRSYLWEDEREAGDIIDLIDFMGFEAGSEVESLMWGFRYFGGNLG